MPSRRPATCRRAPRGSAYVAVLGVCVFVSLVGVTGLVLGRVERRAAEAGREGALARQLAASALELALLEAQDPAWRTGHTSGGWTAARQLGAGTVRYRFIDPADGNLGDDPSEPVRVEAEGAVGGAVRLLSGRLEPDAGADRNLLINDGFEVGMDPWQARDCAIALTSDAKSGAAAARVYNRSSNAAGLFQAVSDGIDAGASYTVGAWVKPSASAEVRLVLRVESSGSGVQTYAATTPAGGGAWTRVEATVTPTWTGTLIDAAWSIETQSGVAELIIDDATLTPQAAGSAMALVPGSIRRQMR